VSDRSCSECGGGLGSRRRDWSSPAFVVEGIVVITTVRARRGGGRALVRNNFGVTAFGAGGVLVSVSRASMMKRRGGAGGVFLGASGRGMSESVAVGTLDVAVSLVFFSTLRRFEKRKRVGRRMTTLSGLTETTNKVCSLESLAGRSLLKYLAVPIVTSFTL